MVALNLRGCILPAARNVTLIHNTVHVTNYVTVDNRIVDHSVHKEKIGRAVGPRFLVPRAGSDSRGRPGRRSKARSSWCSGAIGSAATIRSAATSLPDIRPAAAADGDQNRHSSGPNRRALPRASDAYPPPDDLDRSGRDRGRQNHDSQPADERDRATCPGIGRRSGGWCLGIGPEPGSGRGVPGSGETRPPASGGPIPSRANRRATAAARPVMPILPRASTGTGQRPGRSPGT
jgi:hypothetical protein